jgi:hypothetical protein
MIDDELLQLYRKEVASNMTDKRLFIALMNGWGRSDNLDGVDVTDD